MEPSIEKYLCPLTKQIMKDPVKCSDGKTYERTAIEEWLKQSKDSPITKLPLDNIELIPDTSLLAEIKTYLSKQTSLLQFQSQTGIINNHGIIHLQIIPCEYTSRSPCHFVCVIDISGSMQCDASTVQVGGESDGFSRLDLVKHSVNTVITMLNPNDQLSLVTFSSSAKVVLTPTQMDEKGKDGAKKILNAMQPTASTNLWAGLREGMNVSKTSDLSKRNTVILVFTDGEPNDNPPEGIVGAMKKYIEGKQMPFTVHTFGYGYNLDSQLLYNIAQEGTGMYSYIPDCSMVGTIFVNFLSNTLATICSDASIKIINNGVSDYQLLGFKQQFGRIDVGAIQSGQTRDFIIQFSIPNEKYEFKFILTYNNGQQSEIVISYVDTKENSIDLYREYTRCTYVEMLTSGLSKFAGALKKAQDFLKEALKYPSKSDPKVEALLRDISSPNEMEGQVSKSFEKQEWYAKWGIHYVRSLSRANQMQQCNNFKDPSVQLYGGKLFNELQDQADKVFCQLPPPQPSLPKTSSYDLQNMASYYNAGGVCFDGEGIVELASGEKKKVKELKQGDQVVSANNEIATIKCVLITHIEKGKQIEMVNINNVKLTPWHPVCINNTWEFPININKVENYYIDKIYNLVLNKDHQIKINNLQVITLSHGIIDNPVTNHPYFATEKVIEELKLMPGWNSGEVNIDMPYPKRDNESKLVMSLLEQ